MRTLVLADGKYKVVDRDSFTLEVYKHGMWVYDVVDPLTRAALLKAFDLEESLNAKQAEIDELMLEYCPEKMTKDQMDEWTQCQVALDITVEDSTIIDIGKWKPKND